MKRLLAFGCSNTQGEGLPEFSVNPRTPSRFAWPQLLADCLDRTCVNQGYSGASNKLITNLILDETYQTDDIVIVLWSSFARTHLFLDNGDKMRLVPADCYRKESASKLREWNKKLSKLYYMHFYTDKNHHRDNLIEINFAKQFLDSKGIENYHFCWEKIEHELPHWNQTEIKLINLHRELGITEDKLHPSKLAHKQISRDILCYITEKRSSR